jgi:hypothetical protein
VEYLEAGQQVEDHEYLTLAAISTFPSDLLYHFWLSGRIRARSVTTIPSSHTHSPHQSDSPPQIPATSQRSIPTLKALLMHQSLG